MSENTPPRLVLTVEETAEALTVSVRTVERLIASGKLPSRKIGWRRVVPIAALERFLAESDPVAPEQQ